MPTDLFLFKTDGLPIATRYPFCFSPALPRLRFCGIVTALGTLLKKSSGGRLLFFIQTPNCGLLPPHGLLRYTRFFMWIMRESNPPNATFPQNFDAKATRPPLYR
jgi:hypothetical protein